MQSTNEQPANEQPTPQQPKTKPVAKTIATLNIRPYDDETDMKVLEATVRGIKKDGLVWGATKLVPMAFGLQMLEIYVVVEDAKISLADLEEEIQEFEDVVGSTDIPVMQKL